jgi:hypothetical protein
MSFMYRDGWLCQFLEEVCASSYPFSCRMVEATPRKPWPVMTPLYPMRFSAPDIVPVLND